MSSDLKPIKFWDFATPSPNPPRVRTILEELGLPYEVVTVPSVPDAKGPEYTKINPNGRLPAIYDPNTDLTLWESGAIVLYLVSHYDTSHKLSFPAGSNEAYLAQQWLFFQASGQGPYYGQAFWFKLFHHEQLPSAVERYVKEINRVTGVLDGWLAKQEVAEGSDGPWLVGGRVSYADLAFINWQLAVGKVLEGQGYDVNDYPHVKAWLDRLTARDAVKKVNGL
ncbi:probable glutathione S-transferase Ure2-like [Cephalotrichum gorgonifer]|uniref:Probable glutathione S-transferase Ure2-like n=1 Tax=Cephalotrichum gorgonifer TaxID=2041049 RepID=A0AAE8N586_9PEZI|nr:probable glutathione S-transferase Ure2-like [Cephalotrichum gorgonifer]